MQGSMEVGGYCAEEVLGMGGAGMGSGREWDVGGEAF